MQVYSIYVVKLGLGDIGGKISFPTRNLGMILGYDFAIFLHNAIEKLCSILFY